MPRRRCLGATALALALLSSVAVSAPARGPIGGADIDRYLRDGDYFGAALVARGDHVLLARGYGWADLRRRIRIDARTQFRVTALASQFTDVALLQLSDAGKLPLDASICRVIPRCPPTWRGLTVRELETYMARLPYSGDRLPATAPLERWIDAMRSEHPVRGPAAIRVDPQGTELLEQFLVERASGRSWWSYVRTRILLPAGMRETEYDLPGLPGRRATSYDGTRPLAKRDPSLTADRADGIRSTVGDFLRYSRALEDGRLLSDRSRQELSELVPGSFVKGYYGVWRYGWLVTRMFGHRFEGQHAHGEPGWSTWFVRFPDDGLTIALFQNRTQGSGDVANGLFARLLGCPAGAVPIPTPC